MPISNFPQPSPIEAEVNTPSPALNPPSEVATPIVSPTTPNEGTPMSGLSDAELNDPNSIAVTIPDRDAPLVVLFGPPACGKTMTLVRLTRYLKGQGYIVSPVRTFRPSADTNYTALCDNFNAMMNSNNAAASTNRISFMLVEVIKNDRRVCQILEAPGEYYFNPEQPNAAFPNYVNTIINSNNRKVWAIMLEPNWKDETDRRNYVSRIHFLRQCMRPRDRAIFVLNKVDLTSFGQGLGRVNAQAALKEVKDLYPDVFVRFENQNPITRLWKQYNCDFAPFQTGTYTPTVMGHSTFQEGPDEYCQGLWSKIMNNIRG